MLNFGVCEKEEVTGEGGHGQERLWEKAEVRWLEEGGLLFPQPC